MSDTEQMYYGHLLTVQKLNWDCMYFVIPNTKAKTKRTKHVGFYLGVVETAVL